MQNKIQVGFESPSNIALIKYWGKVGDQLPMNSSLSLTLSHCCSTMEIEYILSDSFKLDFYFDKKENGKFKDKIIKKFMKLEAYFPWLNKSHLVINSWNTFPHSSGIASSASSMSALALCLVELDNIINKKVYSKMEKQYFASKIARLCSGSASRSIFPYCSIWGHVQSIDGTNNEYAIEYNDFHPKFKSLLDAVLIIDSGEKIVSSSAGHELMINHPHRESRIQHANNNLKALIDIMRDGDFGAFADIVEREALDLHSMMMTSSPSYILLRPESLLAIDLIRKFRNNTNYDICFTIDAGPNIHVLYTQKDKEKIEKFIREEFLAKICSDVIWDSIGSGPKAINYV